MSRTVRIIVSVAVALLAMVLAKFVAWLLGLAGTGSEFLFFIAGVCFCAIVDQLPAGRQAIKVVPPAAAP